MKILKLCSFIFIFLILFSCKEEDSASVCSESYPYRAKLAIKGICFNYVIELIDVGSNSNLVEAWGIFLGPPLARLPGMY